MDDLARLLRRSVVTPSGCREFTGCRNAGGYGEIRVAGERFAHRAAWRLQRGPIPDGLYVLHHCDNPPCIEVEHLFLGTYADNAHDRDRKGRHRVLCLRGERHGRSKLSDEDVVRIREIEGLPQRVIAERFGVHQAQVSRIRSGQSRRWG